MNSTVKITAIVMGLLLAIPAYSNISDKVEMSVTGVKSFRLTLKDEANNIEIKIKDQFGQVLYREMVEKPVAYSRVFNVSPLPVGDYSLELEFPNKHQIIPLEIYNNQVALLDTEMTEYFKPTVRQDGTKVIVSMLNISKDPVRILIYDRSTNQLLTEQKFKNQLNVGKQFDFSQVGSGKYLISMKSNDLSYSQTVTIN